MELKNEILNLLERIGKIENIVVSNRISEDLYILEIRKYGILMSFEYVDDSVKNYEFKTRYRGDALVGLIFNNHSIWKINIKNKNIEKVMCCTINCAATIILKEFISVLENLIIEKIRINIYYSGNLTQYWGDEINLLAKIIIKVGNSIFNTRVVDYEKEITNISKTLISTLSNIIDQNQYLVKKTSNESQLSLKLKEVSKFMGHFYFIKNGIIRKIKKLKYDKIYMSISSYPDEIILKIGNYIPNPQKEAEMKSGVDFEGWEIFTPYVILEYKYYRISNDVKLEIIDNKDYINSIFFEPLELGIDL